MNINRAKTSSQYKKYKKTKKNVSSSCSVNKCDILKVVHLEKYHFFLLKLILAMYVFGGSSEICIKTLKQLTKLSTKIIDEHLQYLASTGQIQLQTRKSTPKNKQAKYHITLNNTFYDNMIIKGRKFHQFPTFKKLINNELEVISIKGINGKTLSLLVYILYNIRNNLILEGKHTYAYIRSVLGFSEDDLKNCLRSLRKHGILINNRHGVIALTEELIKECKIIQEIDYSEVANDNIQTSSKPFFDSKSESVKYDTLLYIPIYHRYIYIKRDIDFFESRDLYLKKLSKERSSNRRCLQLEAASSVTNKQKSIAFNEVLKKHQITNLNLHNWNPSELITQQTLDVIRLETEMVSSKMGNYTGGIYSKEDKYTCNSKGKFINYIKEVKARLDKLKPLNDQDSRIKIIKLLLLQITVYEIINVINHSKVSRQSIGEWFTFIRRVLCSVDGKVFMEYKKKAKIIPVPTKTANNSTTPVLKTPALNESLTEWDKVKRSFIKQYGEIVYKQWFKSIEFLCVNNGTIFFTSPSRLVIDWIKTNYIEFLTKEFKKLDGNILECRIELKQISAISQR